jgi:predicted ArsR family transcriptional regulator
LDYREPLWPPESAGSQQFRNDHLATMSTTTEISDARVVDLLRTGSLSIAEICKACGVTATAVRQRLNRLMSQGLVQREVHKLGRGRPEHRYSITELARRQNGNNYADLAIVLWEELRKVKDDEIRRGLLQRVADQLTAMYRGQVKGTTPHERLESLKGLLADRRIPVEVAGEPNQPALKVNDCPYPELASRDRGVCSMERMMIAELLSTPVRLAQCRLDGDGCCQFETKPAADRMAGLSCPEPVSALS